MGSILNNLNPHTLSPDSIGTLIENITNLALGLVGAICVIMIIWGGFQYLTSLGNDEKAMSGKKTLTWAIIGLVVIISALIIINLVLGAVGTSERAT